MWCITKFFNANFCRILFNICFYKQKIYSHRNEIITKQKEMFRKQQCLTLQRLEGGEEGGVSPCDFSKNISSKERVKSCFFVTFNIIISHIFPENLIEIPQVVQKTWRISLSILIIFINFHQFFGFPEISLLQRK